MHFFHSALTRNTEVKVSENKSSQDGSRQMFLKLDFLIGQSECLFDIWKFNMFFLWCLFMVAACDSAHSSRRREDGILKLFIR